MIKGAEKPGVSICLYVTEKITCGMKETWHDTWFFHTMEFKTF